MYGIKKKKKETTLNYVYNIYKLKKKKNTS